MSQVCTSALLYGPTLFSDRRKNVGTTHLGCSDRTLMTFANKIGPWIDFVLMNLHECVDYTSEGDTEHFLDAFSRKNYGR